MTGGLCARGCSTSMRRTSIARWWNGSTIAAPAAAAGGGAGASTARRCGFGSVLDLGCGTGLGGAAFRPYCDWLVGRRSFAGMIEQARAKGLYDRLGGRRICWNFSRREAGAQHHLVLAADVFVYCSDLAPIAAAVARRCWRRAGCSPSRSRPMTSPACGCSGTLRYAHGAAHVRAAIAGGGPATSAARPRRSTRTEKGVPVPGLVVVASTPPFSPSNAEATR